MGDIKVYLYVSAHNLYENWHFLWYQAVTLVFDLVKVKVGACSVYHNSLNLPACVTWETDTLRNNILCRLRSIATHRITFSVICRSVCPSVTLFCHTFQSYVSQATHAFLGMLPLFFCLSVCPSQVIVKDTSDDTHYLNTYCFLFMSNINYFIQSSFIMLGSYEGFMPLAWKAHCGHLVIKLSVCLSVILSCLQSAI